MTAAADNRADVGDRRIADAIPAVRRARPPDGSSSANPAPRPGAV
ncbi:hypothetical protein ACRAWF_11150 [Streptomyces sp. L7]